ncbi:RtcB family protein [Burkholderia multivorans]|jgi:tRNA-splicing ligase RtcB|uniref:RtcB family protein n=1 Tax=Burkholderia multivorans TaxID=87883 RepID=UPI001C239D97|nr:RtcB family protein [Burkholderia multivorans]MBU9200080.1 RtcB family protein [Burkholderia multivorans]MDN8078799.1 RtcB family protein [Burkholderia multivorans]
MDAQQLKAHFGDKVRFWTGAMSIEDAAVKQLQNISELPILAGPLAIMPDVHMGKGATVGSVIPTLSAVIPSAVGVDIGCGMIAVRTGLTASDLPDSLAAMRAAIERAVPVGFSYHSKQLAIGSESASAAELQRRYDGLMAGFAGLSLFAGIGHFDVQRMTQQVGTLGGGNHFIEVCLDESQQVWLMLHSGSRNVGKTVGEAAMEAAKQHVASLDITLKDRDLAWLDDGTVAFEQYTQALSWAQDYARLNRDVMLHLVIQAIEKTLGRSLAITDEAVNCHHNYLSKEEFGGKSVWITRKGAVSARAGQMGIIPGSMGAKSFIVCGKGHEAAYCSCSHGAGRKMSRSAAKKYFTAEDVAEQTAGVECRKDADVVDEIPAAYKSIDEVMAAQTDLVEIKHTLKQVLCVKG